MPAAPLPSTIPAATAPDPTASPKQDVIFVRSTRAERYRLTVRADGVAVATIPVSGNEREAQAFVNRHRDWLERARARQRQRPRAPTVWTLGTRILWRGENTEIGLAVDAPRAKVRLGADVFSVTRLEGDLRPVLQAHFLRLAKIELPARTWELAARTGVAIRRVCIRNQRTRWGSCTASGVISLNWRLIQCPEAVRDYVIYHELMHRHEMNHSARFWRRVAEVCPEWEVAETWLKRHGAQLGL